MTRSTSVEHLRPLRAGRGHDAMCPRVWPFLDRNDYEIQSEDGPQQDDGDEDEDDD